MSMLKKLSSRWSLKDDYPIADSTLRRREQLRKAQKKHRTRKEEYFNSLEAEVVHLRTRQSDMLKQTCKLSAEIEWLRKIINQHNINIPPMPAETVISRQDDSFCHPSVIVSLHKDHVSCGRLLVRDFVSSEPTNHVHSGCDMGLSDVGPLRSEIDKLQKPNNSMDLGDFNQEATLGQESDIVFAMDFILSLEEPCLEHVRHALQQPDIPNGHAFTMTASMLHLCENSGSSAQNLNPTRIPRKTVERLLELSSELTTDDHLTPTQVWALLNGHPRFADVSKTKVESLTKALVNHTKCYGFGAVIERSILTKEIFHFFNCTVQPQLE